MCFSVTRTLITALLYLKLEKPMNTPKLHLDVTSQKIQTMTFLPKLTSSFFFFLNLKYVTSIHILKEVSIFTVVLEEQGITIARYWCYLSKFTSAVKSGQMVRIGVKNGKDNLHMNKYLCWYCSVHFCRESP